MAAQEISLHCPHCRTTGHLTWGNSHRHSGRRRIGSLSKGFVFIGGSAHNPRVECEPCRKEVPELVGLVEGWDTDDDVDLSIQTF